jgi:hypothetical protein
MFFGSRALRFVLKYTFGFFGWFFTRLLSHSSIPSNLLKQKEKEDANGK